MTVRLAILAAGVAAAAACSSGAAVVADRRFIPAHTGPVAGYQVQIGAMWAVRVGDQWYQVSRAEHDECAPGAPWPACAEPGPHRRLTANLQPAE